MVTPMGRNFGSGIDTVMSGKGGGYIVLVGLECVTPLWLRGFGSYVTMIGGGRIK